MQLAKSYLVTANLDKCVDIVSTICVNNIANHDDDVKLAQLYWNYRNNRDARLEIDFRYQLWQALKYKPSVCECNWMQSAAAIACKSLTECWWNIRCFPLPVVWWRAFVHSTHHEARGPLKNGWKLPFLSTTLDKCLYTTSASDWAIPLFYPYLLPPPPWKGPEF